MIERFEIFSLEKTNYEQTCSDNQNFAWPIGLQKVVMNLI
jgi:hypothetical protein